MSDDADTKIGQIPEEVADQLLQDGWDLAGLETALIERAMERSSGNVTRAAALLGLTRATLDYRLKKLHS